MSSFDDELSDASFDGSLSADGNEEPPTLDEVLFDMSLFKLFMAYMKSHNGAANLTFLKQTRLLRIYNAPRAVWMTQAIKHIWTFFAECAPMPVTVSDDVKKKLQEMSLDPEKEALLDKDSFSVAFGEVYNVVVPDFRNWVSTGEWHDAVPFQRLAPPTFNIVLTSNTLRVLFNKYIKGMLSSDPDGTVAQAYHLWKFCIIANDFRDGNYSHSSHIEGKKKKKTGETTTDKKEEDSETLLSPRGDEKKSTIKENDPEDYARHLYKKYKHHLTLPYDGTIPYAVFVLRSLDYAIEGFDKSPLFTNWIALKQYNGVDYQAKVVHQTLTPEGYAEPPTVAATMCSSMLPFFLVMIDGTETGLNLQFLNDIHKFYKTYGGDEKVPDRSRTPSSSGTNSSSSEVTHKDMVDEARRIYSKYLESGEMYCDPKLLEEVRNALSKSNGKGVTPSMFRKCGAFIYQRSEHTWGREARGTIAWANKTYENRSRAARAIEEEFAMKLLPEDMDLQIVPNLDDVLQNPELSQDFGEFCGEKVATGFAGWQKAYGEYFQTPIHQRKPILQKLFKAFGDCATAFPQLQPLREMFEREAAAREKLSESILLYCTRCGIRAIAQKYYLRYLVERNVKWKTTPWKPSRILCSVICLWFTVWVPLKR